MHNNLSPKWLSAKGTRSEGNIDFRLATAKFIHLLSGESQTALLVTDVLFVFMCSFVWVQVPGEINKL